MRFAGVGARSGARVALSALLFACNALDDPSDEQQGIRIVPTDERPALVSATPPPALNGGTLLVTRDGAFAVAADEARDRVSVVDLANRRWLGELAFARGAEPGRVVEGENGTVFVVLRRAGSIAAVSLESRSLIAEYPVCAAPRGAAFDAETGALQVACASGRLVTLSAAGERLREVQLPNDLRDVVIENGNLWVSRFRSAEVLRIDASGAVAERLSPPTLVRSRLDDDFISIEAPFEPNTAWRMTANPTGGVAIVHQRATTEEISLEPSDSGGTAYGSAGGICNGIERTSVTTFQSGGRVISGPDVSATLPVDLIMQANGRAAVLGAGKADSNAPTSTFVSIGDGLSFGGSIAPRGDFFFGTPVSLLDVNAGDECFSEPLNAQPPEIGPEQYVVSVAAFGARYVLQMRDPAQLVIMGNDQPDIVPLGGDSIADTGFDLFHRNAEAGISCASCHPGGTDDGHVWRFEDQGPRRTQPIDVGLEGTAPFHWDGLLPDVSELMNRVFVDRMGGVHQSPERKDALQRWLFALTPPPTELAIDSSRVFRGRRLFESFDVGCADCHRGARLTDNNSYDVATGEPGEKFQVPSLIGLGTRSRLIHDGCASTLAERFGPTCGGGDRHGRTSQLSAEQLDDLIGYLETL
ncbi:MAG TPA: cytochrome-c peroxidase [Polyangiaceae bacterium]|nr:cytochrome-c peroxidase [Polyangiaceae bacterium]